MTKSLAQPRPLSGTLGLGDVGTLRAGSSLLLIAALSYAGFRLASPNLPLAPGTAVLLTALLLTRPRSWWLCLAAAFPGSILASVQAGVPTVAAPSIFAAHASIALVGATGVQRYTGQPFRFDGVQPIGVYTLSAVLAGPVVGATALALPRWFGLDAHADLVPYAATGATWRVTFLVNALTAIALTPSLLLLAHWGAPRMRVNQLPRLVEATLLVDRRRERRDATRQDEARYRAVIDASSELICRYLPDGTLTFVNEAYCRAFGTSREALIGTNFLDLLPPEARAAAAEHIASIIARPRREMYEHQVVQSDGRIGWQEWIDVAVTGPDGSAIEIQAVGRDVTDRHYAQEALRRSEERYRAVAGMTSDYVYEVSVTPDGQRKVRWVTDRVTEITGYNFEELQAMGTMAPFVYDEDQEIYEEHISRLLDGRPSKYEVRFRHKDGSVRWQQIQVRPEPDPERPGYMRWLGAAKDITDRKEAEQERTHLAAQIEREHARMDALLEHIPAMIWEARTTPTGEIVHLDFISEYAETLSGYRLDEWFSRPDFWLSIVHPDDRTAAANRLAEVVAIGAGTNQYRVQTRDGRTIWAESHIRVVHDDAGAPVGVRGVTLDVTERVQARERVRAAFADLQSTIDSLTAQVAILDTHGRIVAVNEAWRRFASLGGLPITANGAGDDYLGICDRAARGGDLDAERAAAGIRSVMDGGSSDYRMVYPSNSPGGTRWFQMRVTRFRSAGETRLVVAHEDVTELKQAEESLQVLASRLLQLQDDERRRIARELHDVTAQNLFAITMNLTRLRSSTLVDARGLTLLTESLALGEQSLKEIRTLSYVLHPPLLDHTGLGPALQWYVDGFTSRSGIDVQLVAAGDLGRLPQETETALFRIVQESLTNIHRHSGSGSAAIRLSRAKDHIVLQVRDSGNGIRREVLAAAPDEVRSLGVGIPGMRQRMRQLGGDLRIESRGRGTTVTVTAPAPPAVES